MESPQLKTILCLVLSLVVSTGCSSVIAEVPTYDSNVLVVRGYGTKSKVEQKCLTADTIEKLINSKIPSNVPKQSCYWVVLVSSDSSDISKSIGAFISAKNEFDDKIANLVTKPTPQPGPNEPLALTRHPKPNFAAEVVRALVASSIEEDASSLRLKVKNLPNEQKPAVKEMLKVIIQQTTNRKIKDKLQAALMAL